MRTISQIVKYFQRQLISSKIYFYLFIKLIKTKNWENFQAPRFRGGKQGAGEAEGRSRWAQRAIMRSGVHRGSGITVPQLRIREYERLEESRTKVSDFSETKISSLGRDRIFSNHQLFLISLS